MTDRKRAPRQLRRGGWGRRRPELIGFAFASIAAAAFWAAVPGGLAAVGGGNGSNTTFTTSTTAHTTVTFIGSGGNAYLATPSALAALQGLGAAGLPAGVETRTEFSFTSSVALGPGTILIGLDQSVTFFVAPGTSNINTNTHTETFLQVTLSANTLAAGWVFGDFHTAFPTALLDRDWSFLDALFGQLRGFGANGAGPGAALPFAQFASSAVGDTPQAAAMLSQRGPDGRLQPSPWFVWVRPHGTLGKVDDSSERLGFKYDIAGVTAGAEHRWPGPWLAGGFLGYAHTTLSQNTTSDKGRIENLQLGAYLGYRDQRLHVLAAGLFSQNWLNSERLTALAPATAKASYSGQTFSFGVEAGRKYPAMGSWVQPIASLIYTHLRTGRFTESGSTLLEISGASNSVNALKLSLGARVWRDFDLFGATLTPEFRARWVQDLLNERRALTGRFVGDPAQTAFTVNGAKPAPAAAILGAGVTLRGGRSFKASLGYDAELRANATAHTIHATLKLTW